MFQWFSRGNWGDGVVRNINLMWLINAEFAKKIPDCFVLLKIRCKFACFKPLRKQISKERHHKRIFIIKRFPAPFLTDLN